MSDFPYRPVEVTWKRPSIGREILKRWTKRSDLQGFLHCLNSERVLACARAPAYAAEVAARYSAGRATTGPPSGKAPGFRVIRYRALQQTAE